MCSASPRREGKETMCTKRQLQPHTTTHATMAPSCTCAPLGLDQTAAQLCIAGGRAGRQVTDLLCSSSMAGLHPLLAEEGGGGDAAKGQGGRERAGRAALAVLALALAAVAVVVDRRPWWSAGAAPLPDIEQRFLAVPRCACAQAPRASHTHSHVRTPHTCAAPSRRVRTSFASPRWSTSRAPRRRSGPPATCRMSWPRRSKRRA